MILMHGGGMIMQAISGLIVRGQTPPPPQMVSGVNIVSAAPGMVQRQG